MTSFFLWMSSRFLFLFLTVFFFFIVPSKASICDILPLLWQKASSPPCMDAQLLYDLSAPWISGKYCWKPMLCGNDRISCQSAPLHPPILYVVGLCHSKNKKNQTHKCLYGVWLLLFSVLLVSSQIRALLRLRGMLFVHQANHLLKLYVFLRMLSLWHTASCGGALPIIWCERGALREPLPAAQTRVCGLTPGSLSARHQIMGRARGSPLLSSPHHSFRELISSSLWPAIICSISWPISELSFFFICSNKCCVCSRQQMPLPICEQCCM